MAAPSIVRAVQRHGFVGTVRIAWEKLGRRGSHVPSGPSAFDQQYGVNTDGDDDLRDLSIDAPGSHILHGNRYQATSPEMFAKIMRVAPIVQDMTFIDIGSGKGRALLMASAYPFKRIIGVEFAHELHAAAEDNIRKFGSPKSIEAICADALAWDLPDEPSLVYVYNSFGKPLMSQFIERLESSLMENPRELVVVYRNPTCRELWTRSQWKLVHDDPMFMVLRPPAR